MKIKLLVAALIVVASQSGCVAGRRTFAITVPSADAATPAAAAPRGRVQITSVTDNRVFQNKPPEPYMPSVDGDVAKMTPDLKERMIGRQRNGYGGALGDIALPEGDSVPKQARLLVESAFKRRGYQIATDSSAPTTASVSIDEFWGWMDIGFWSVDFKARAYLTLTVNGKPVVVQGYGKNIGQVAADRNWQQAFDLAFKDFFEKFDAEMAKAGF